MPFVTKKGPVKKKKKKRKVTELQHPLKSGQRTTNHVTDLSRANSGTLEQTAPVVLQRHKYLNLFQETHF